MKVLIKNSESQGFIDYTRYVLDGTLTVEDSVNVPTLTSFQLAASDNSFVVPKRSAYFKIISEIFSKNGGYLGQPRQLPQLLDITGMGSVFKFATRVVNGNAYVIDSVSKILYKVPLTTNAGALPSPVLTITGNLPTDTGMTYSPVDIGSSGVGNTEIDLDPQGNVYVSLTASFGYFGLLAKLNAQDKLVGSQGDSGTCTQGINTTASNCCTITAPCFGSGGDTIYVPFGQGYIAMAYAVPVNFGNQVTLIRASDLAVLGGVGGYFNYGGADGISNPALAADASGGVYCLQNNASNVILTVCKISGGASPTCGGGCPSPAQIWAFNTVNTFDLTAQLGTTGSGRDRGIGLNPIDGTLIMATNGGLGFVKWSPATQSVVRTTDGFTIIDTTTLTVVRTITGISARKTPLGNSIPSGTQGQTAYDPCSNSIVFYANVAGSTSKLFRIYLGVTVPVNTTPCGLALATGFVTNEPERTYLGLNAHLPKFNNEQYAYNINGTSDEWILNSRTVPFIPAFVNQTDSQILASLANVLAPGFFDTTSLMASGTIIPFFQYDPSQTWSDIAKTFADANRFHYKVTNQKILYQPFGDQPLGIAFDDQNMKKRDLFPSELKTGVLTVPPVNDCIVIGDIEPQANWENYFVGDGFTSNFLMRHQVFQGTTSQLLQDDWTESSFQGGTWIDNDPQGVIFLADGNGNPLGALNVAQKGITGVQYLPQLNATFVQAQNGLELGGGINLQHGQFVFNDQCNGLLGSIFGTSTFTPGNVLAGFSVTGQSAAGPFTSTSVQINANSNLVVVTINGQISGVQQGNVVVGASFVGASFLNGVTLAIKSITFSAGVTTLVLQGTTIYLAAYGPTADSGTLTAPSNAVLVTASGAAGVVIQPVYLGQNVGPKVVSQINHQYVLQTWVGATARTRYTRPYTNLTQSATYGNQNLAAAGTLTFVVTDVNLGDFVIQQQNPLFGLFPAAPPPVVTKYSVNNTNLPPFALYCLLNAINLNISINYTDISLPPQGFLSVQSLTGASGGKLPWLPAQLTPPITYQLGFGMINQTAQVSQQGEAFALSFYTDDIPSVGARIRFQSWAAGQSVARVIDPIAIAAESSITGDSGVRSAIMQNLSPLPRTSDECEAAAAAAIRDREYPQFQGTYTLVMKPYFAENLMSPSLYQFPTTGRFLWINSPVRAITGQNFFANTVRMQVVELRDEIINASVDYGPDLYLENLLPSFLEREQTLLVPKQTVAAPNPVTLPFVLNAHLPTLDRAQVTQVVNSLTGNYITVDLGAPPVTGCEVRNVDGGWGIANQGLIGSFSTQVFTLPRTVRDQTWYLRTRNGSVFSRFSKALRVVYPLIPSAPTLVQANSNTAVFDFAGDVRDIYGIEVKAQALSGVFFVQFPNVPQDNIYQFARNSILVPTDPAAGGLPVKNNNNVTAIYDPPSNQFPFPFPEQFQLGDIIFSSCPTDSSFGNVQVVSNILTATGSQGPVPVSNSQIGFLGLYAFFFNAVHGSNGTYYHPHPLGVGYAGAGYDTGVRAIPRSLLFNVPNVAAQPMTNTILDSNGNNLGQTVLWSGMTQGWDMAITGTFVVPVAGSYSVRVAHDDGFFWGIGGGATMTGTFDNISQGTTTILGLTAQGGINRSGSRVDNFVVTFPSAGSYVFEINYSQWYNEQDLQFTVNGFNILPASLTPAVSGSPWGLGWFDYRKPYPDTVGQAIQYGLSNPVGTEQLYYRPPTFSIAASGSISGGNTGICTIYTNGAHGFSLGQQVIIGVGWQTFPQSGYPRLPNTGAVFCGVQTITAVPSSTSFQFVSSVLTNFAAIVPGSWEAVVDLIGVIPQYLNGVVSPMPTPFNLAASSGIIIQRPVFAPSDLVVNFTNADIAQQLGILQLLSPNGRVGGLMARFFNLTWDYSFPTTIPSFQVPSLTGVFIDPSTQSVTWSVATGRPTGYRVLLSDPTTGQVLNRFTVDHPYNTQLLKQFQMTPLDFASNRLITVTPFDVTGDGIPLTVFHQGSSAGGGGTGNTNIYVECIDVRTFGAVGDGVTDDTVAIQNALNQAQANSQGPFPAPSESIVCIPSSMVCLVTPQFLDGTPTASGYGPTAVCLTIGGGVTLRLDGQLKLGSNGSFLSNPWVILENYSAYSILGTGDVDVSIEGQGIFNCNFSALSHSVGAVKFQGVSGCKIQDVAIQQQNNYGIYCLGCNDVSIEHLQTFPVATQGGFLIVFDKCINAHAVGCSIDGSFSSVPTMSFLADYGSVGTLVDQNSIYSIEGTLVSRFNYGFDDKIIAPKYSGLRVSNNTFVSGSVSGSFVVTCVASGVLDYGVVIDGNMIINCKQSGIQIGNLADALIVNNTVQGVVNGLAKATGTVLQTTSIFNNVIHGNVIDIPVVTSPTSPIFNDGSSTATMYNPAIDRQLYASFAPQQPTILGVTPSGQSGYAFPIAPPDDFYAVSLTGTNVTGSIISSSGTVITIAPFKIIWPDKTNLYLGGNVSAPSIYGTFSVFVDDPYRDANGALITYGVTTNPSDLATSAGRYHLGTVSVASTSGTVMQGGNIPATAMMAILQQPYDIGCTWQGTLTAGGKIVHLPIVCSLLFLLNMYGSRAHLLTGPAGTVTIPVLKNGVQFGTVTFAPGITEATFSASPTSMSPVTKDVLTVDLTAVVDASASDLGIILRAFRTMIGT